MRLLQGGGIGDPLAPLFTRDGVEDAMGGADTTCVQRRRRVDGPQLSHEGLVNAAAKRAERLGSHTVGLRGLDRIVSEAPGRP